MPTKKLKNWLPTPEQIMQTKGLQPFAHYLSDPRLWHFNRRCLNKAVYVGVMSAFFPLPGQTLVALIFSLYFRANVPFAVALTWITNPITTIPVFYASYYVGAKILGKQIIGFRQIGHMLSDLSLWIFADGVNPFITYQHVFSLSAFCLGLLILAVITSLVCGLTFRFFWQYKIIRTWQKRHGYRPAHLLDKHKY